MDEFKDHIPQSTAFSVGYFEGRQSTKYWICIEQYLIAMYNRCHNEIMLWCNGHIADKPSAKRPRAEGINTKREEKETRVEVLAKELKEQNSDKMELTEPQYRLWAHMIVIGVHADKDLPLQIPIISGVTPKCKTKDDNNIVNTTAAVLKVINGGVASNSALGSQSQSAPESSASVGKSGNLGTRC